MKQNPQQTSHPFLDLDAEPILQIIELFRQRAELMKFPDVDAETLSAGLEQVESQRELVEAAAVALDEARQSLLASELALLEQARRGHAYATIFAANDEELGAELAEIKLNPPGKGAKSREVKKRRPLPRRPDVQNAKSRDQSSTPATARESREDESVDEVAAE